MEKILFFTATYNEVDNIESLIHDIFSYYPQQNILVIDDSSPDGTGAVLDKISKNNSNVHVVHRPRKLGLGTAHKLAMKYAIYHEYDILVTMDADYSHNPKYLPELIEHMQNNDFVIGSRFMKDGRLEYGLFRSMISKTANILTKNLLGIKLNETTTSYRGFKVSMLKQFNFDNIHSDGYSFFVESLFYISMLTKKLKEFPIHFEDRRAGQTKISYIEIYNGFITLLRLTCKKLFTLKSLKQGLFEKNISQQSDCINCGSPHHKEVYPSTQTETYIENVFSCTSFRHRSHGRIVRCLQCGLVFINTPNQPDFYSKMYASVKDPVYIANISARYETFRYNFLQIKKFLPKKGRLLDVGAYCGAFLPIAKEFGFESLGLEPSEWAVKYAKEVLGQNVINGTLNNLDNAISDFDVITLWDVLEHMPDPNMELSLIYKRLKPGGILSFSTLNFDNWFPKILGKYWPWLMDMHLYYFNIDNIKDILRKNNFRLLHVQSYCHIITLNYFLLKLDSLGIPGVKYLNLFYTKLFNNKHWYIPFRMGDIQLFVAEKI